MEYIGSHHRWRIFVNNIVYRHSLRHLSLPGCLQESRHCHHEAAVTFVLTIATLVTFLLYKSVLEPFNLKFLQTITQYPGRCPAMTRSS